MNLINALSAGTVEYLKRSDNTMSVCRNSQFRWLQFDDIVQSVMQFDCPWQLTMPHQFAFLYPLAHSHPRHAVQYGLGGGNINRYLRHHYPELTLVTVESQQAIIDVYQHYFQPQSADELILLNDALSDLRQRQKQSSDWLIIDIYAAKQNQQHIYRAMCYWSYQVLRPQGWLSINFTDFDAGLFEFVNTHLPTLFGGAAKIIAIPDFRNKIVHIQKSASN